MKPHSSHIIILTLAIVSILALATSSCGDRNRIENGKDRIHIFVSIVPQKTFVQAIAEDNADVHVMIRPGFSPATYDPTPRQLLELARADIYLKIGVPFEEAWMDRIQDAGRAMRIVDTRQGIKLLDMDEHDHGHDHDHGRKDPHIWLDPVRVKQQTNTIADALKAVDYQRAAAYDANLQSLHQRLDELDRRIAERIHDSGVKKFLIFHPSLGYFAERYGLEQIAIETEGKSPGAATLQRIIDRARSENIRVVFVQKEFSSHAAEKIAEAIDGTVVVLDPLAPDYFDNMLRIADAIATHNPNKP